MSLEGKDLQVIDVFDIMVNIDGKTLFTGLANESSIENKNEKIDIWAGIGQGKISSLKTKKETTMKFKVAKFDLDYLAAINGVSLDKTSTGSYYFNKSFTVTTLAATVTGATRILGVRKADGTMLKMVSGDPAAIDEVKVAGTALTFYTGFSDTTVLVTYAGAKTEGKDNLTIKFNSKSFPKNASLLARTVVYDGATENIVADAYIDFYQAAMNGDYTWTFSMGKNIETEVEFEILVPKLLPDGTANVGGDTGKLVVTER